MRTDKLHNLLTRDTYIYSQRLRLYVHGSSAAVWRVYPLWVCSHSCSYESAFTKHVHNRKWRQVRVQRISFWHPTDNRMITCVSIANIRASTFRSQIGLPEFRLLPPLKPPVILEIRRTISVRKIENRECNFDRHISL